LTLITIQVWRSLRNGFKTMEVKLMRLKLIWLAGLIYRVLAKPVKVHLEVVTKTRKELIKAVQEEDMSLVEIKTSFL